MHVFVFFLIFTSFGKLWSLNNIILYAEYTKDQIEKENFLMVWYLIVLYRFISIGIVSYMYHKKIKGTHP